MSFSDHPPNSNHSSPSNAIVHQDVIHNPNDRDTTAVVSPPQNAIRPTNENTILTENASVVSTKLVLKNEIIIFLSSTKMCRIQSNTYESL